jgi:hypothetical protein
MVEANQIAIYEEALSRYESKKAAKGLLLEGTV